MGKSSFRTRAAEAKEKGIVKWWMQGKWTKQSKWKFSSFVRSSWIIYSLLVICQRKFPHIRRCKWGIERSKVRVRAETTWSRKNNRNSCVVNGLGPFASVIAAQIFKANNLLFSICCLHYECWNRNEYVPGHVKSFWISMSFQSIPDEVTVS